MKSFQLPRKANTASVTSTGFRVGSTMLQKMRHSPAPSSRAASSNSSGTPRAYCRTRKMPKMPARLGISTPIQVFTRPMPLSIRNSGSIATWPGMTRAAISSPKSFSRCRKRSLANE